LQIVALEYFGGKDIKSAYIALETLLKRLLLEQQQESERQRERHKKLIEALKAS